jgi:muramidase (phage lysozyme)
MTLSLEGLRAALTYANVRAFLHAIQEGEVYKQFRHTPDAYRQLFGGALCDSLARHPQQAMQSPWGWTSAAGAYQAMCAVPGKVTVDTWGDFCRDMGSTVEIMPFDAETQDLFAVWCLRRRGALKHVIDGEFDAAVAKCVKEWASFPGSPYGQPTVTLEQLRACYSRFGGTFALSELLTQPAAPIEERDLSGIPPRAEQEAPMPEESPSFDWSALAKAGGAIASIFNPAIGLAISALSPLLQEKITKVVGKHVDDPKVAQEIGKNLSDVVMDTTKRVTGKTDDLEAVAVMRKDPALVAKVEAAVTSKLAEIAPFLDKVTELETRERADTLTAQDAAAARAKGEAWDMTPWLVGFMGGMVLLVVGFFGAVAIMDMVKNGKVATEVWAALTGVSGTLLGILGTIYAYRFASTQQSAAKNAIIGEIARGKAP